MNKKVCGYFTVAVILYVICICAPFAIFGWSAAQIAPHVKTANGTTITNGGTLPKDVCDSVAALKLHRPSRFYLNHDKEALGCGWSTKPLAARMSIAIAAGLVAIVSFILSMVKRSPIATYVLSAVLVAGGVGFFWLLVVDAKAVSASDTWCDKQLTGIPWGKAPKSITCGYWPFAMICFLEGLSGTAWLLLAVISVLYLCAAGPRTAKDKGILATGADFGETDAAAEDAAQPTAFADATPTTPLVNKAHSASAGDDSNYQFSSTSPASGGGNGQFDFGAQSTARTTSPAAFAPAPAPATATASPAKGKAAPAPAPAQTKTSTSAGFDFESMSKNASSGGVDFSKIETQR